MSRTDLLRLWKRKNHPHLAKTLRADSEGCSVVFLLFKK